MHNLPENIYPIDAFPHEISAAIYEVHNNVKAHPIIIANTFLTAMAASTQNRIKVQLPHGGHPRSVGLFIWTIAESGDRKTAVEQRVLAPLHSKNEQLEKSFEARKEEHLVKLVLWTKIHNELLNKYAKGDHIETSPEVCENDILAHAKLKPKAPIKSKLISQDMSQRSFLELLQGYGKSLSLLCDEGDIILKSPLIKNNGLLNKAWDGGSIIFERANDVSISAHEMRLTFSAFVQNNVFDKYLDTMGDDLRNSGFLARCLIARPPSLKGYRFENFQEISWKHLDHFHEMLSINLDAISDSGQLDGTDQIVYELDYEAQLHWNYLINHTEKLLQPNQYLHDISDFAAKACEMTARIAALLHHFSQPQGKISRDTLSRAAAIVSYHLEETKRLFSLPAPAFRVHEDAQLLWNYISNQFASNRNAPISKNGVMQNGPLRSKRRLQPALALIESHRYITVQKDERGRSFIYRSQVQPMTIGAYPH